MTMLLEARADQPGVSDERALILPPSDTAPSRSTQLSIWRQSGEAGRRVMDLVLRGEMGGYVLFSPYVEGRDVGQKIAPEVLERHPNKVLMFEKPHEAADGGKTFLMVVSVSPQSITPSPGVYDANVIERHGLFLLTVPASQRIEAQALEEFLSSWSGRMSHDGLDRLFPDTSEYGLNFYHEQLGLKRDEVGLFFDHVYPPLVRPTEFQQTFFVATESGPIRISAVETDEEHRVAENIMGLNSRTATNTDLAASLLARAETRGGNVGSEILAEVIGSNLESKTISSEDLNNMRNTLNSLAEVCNNDPRMLEMLKRATWRILVRVHPDIPGAKERYNKDVVSLLTGFNDELGKTITAWERARQADQ